MTEDEAKTKWCPFARALIWTTGPSLNRYDGDENLERETCCLASACMAWRLFKEGQGFCGLANFHYAYVGETSE